MSFDHVRMNAPNIGQKWFYREENMIPKPVHSTDIKNVHLELYYLLQFSHPGSGQWFTLVNTFDDLDHAKRELADRKVAATIYDFRLIRRTITDEVISL